MATVPDGSGQTSITPNETMPLYQGHRPSGVVSRQLANQGTRLAAVGTAVPTTNRDIWVMSASGGGQAAIETSPAHDVDPDWQPAPPSTPIPPPNDFQFGKVQKNKKKGTAVLPVIVPAPGSLQMAGKNVAKVSKTAAGAGTTNLKVRATGHAKRKLKREGKVKVRPKVTFTPTGGTANTEQTKVKLIKKRRELE